MVDSESQKTHLAKIGPDGAPSSRFFRDMWRGPGPIALPKPCIRSGFAN